MPVFGRLLKKILAIALLFPASLALVCSAAAAQRSSAPAAPVSESAQPAAAPRQQEPSPSPAQSAPGNIFGTILDTSGDVLEDATVTLTDQSGAPPRTVKSGNDGQFIFSPLPPGVYRITVTAPGMVPLTSDPISLAPGQAFIQPALHLAVASATTSVTVSANGQQISLELSRQQVQIAVQQRVAGVFPNFYSSYDWNAPPMRARQKFQLGLHSVFDPVSYFTVAAVAGVEQARNIFPAYGQGAEGFGKRYGAAYANYASSDLLGRAVFPALFHQDPRYFYRGTGSVPSRALYAILETVISRDDSGRPMPNYSNILANFSSGAISNLYDPAANRGASLVFVNGLVNTGADAGANLVREFLLKRFTSHAPKSGAGQP